MCVTTVPHPWKYMDIYSLIYLLWAPLESVPVLLPSGLTDLGFRQSLLQNRLERVSWGSSLRQQASLSMHEAGLPTSLYWDDLRLFFQHPTSPEFVLGSLLGQDADPTVVCDLQLW